MLDLDHSHRESEDGAVPQSYTLDPGSGLILDTSRLQPEVEGKICNSIQLVLAADRQYSATFDPAATRHPLNAATLAPNPGSQPFDGILAGDTCVIAIGHWAQEGNEPPSFSVGWVSMAKVTGSR